MGIKSKLILICFNFSVSHCPPEFAIVTQGDSAYSLGTWALGTRCSQRAHNWKGGN